MPILRVIQKISVLFFAFSTKFNILIPLKKVFKFLFSILIFLGFSNVHAQCSPSFSYSKTICKGEQKQFTASTTGSKITYDWNFGDPSSGAANFAFTSNPKHIFNKAGTYKVRLIVKDTSKGCVDSLTQSVTVYDKPTASFTIDNACKNLALKITNTSTENSADSVAQWKWNFGKGSTYSSKNPSHSYNATGTDTIKLVVISKSGCIDSFTKIITVYQTPVGKVSDTSICEKISLTFHADTLSGASSYNWNYGDSSSGTGQTSKHVYTVAKKVYPKLTVTFPTTSCTVPVHSVVIHKNPDATFTVIKDTQCFRRNNVCIKLSSKNKSLKSRKIIFDDGYIDDFSAFKDTLICHAYADQNGGKYSITVEMVDSNNCSAQITKDSVVYIRPIISAKLTNNLISGCFGTTASFTNSSSVPFSEIKKFTWIFDDGTTDTTNWSNPSHKYTKDGDFYAKLAITDKNGCTDTFQTPTRVRNTSFPVDAKITKIYSKCYSDNKFDFSQTTIANSTITWSFIGPTTSNIFSGSYHYSKTGVFYPYVTISKNGCDSIRKLDSIVITGPIARFRQIKNQFQCQAHDTVYFENGSFSYRNKKLVSLWNADDLTYNCTTDTKAGINKNQNCNYSKDSLKFKHFYPRLVDKCYNASLRVTDTALGCTDITYAQLPLMKPIAKGSFTPSDTLACPGPSTLLQNKTVWFDSIKPQPSCLKYAMWIMWDSLQAAKSGNFNNYWTYNKFTHNYALNPLAGDSLGYVTTGLIVENGTDTNGVICRDTAWFPRVIRIVRLSSKFTTTYNPNKYICKNTKLLFYLADSNQTKGSKFTWNFGDGTVVSDTVQHFKSHTYKNAGDYRVILRVVNPTGCLLEDTQYIHVGFKINLYVTRNFVCVRDTIAFQEDCRYYPTGSSPAGLFSTASRATAGKEKCWYNLDDGKGYRYIASNFKIAYPSPGIYNLSLIAKDSVGCYDTVTNIQQIQVSGLYAGFTTLADTFLCPQSVKLTSTASTTDSSKRTLSGDFINDYTYDLGPQFAKIKFPNPTKFLNTGTYKITQTVKNSRGCIDSFKKTILVVGPTAKYEISSDSIGCSPLKVVFKNKSTYGTNYIWQFNDINNNILNTTKDTTVSLNYTGYGDFYPYLIARGTFTINGSTNVCSTIYPDTSLGFKHKITVWELQKMNFSWSTNCKQLTTYFYNNSSIKTGYLKSFVWEFGDGTSSTQENPIHQWKDTGYYRVKLTIYSDKGCSDTLVKFVKVSFAPVPDFTVTSNCIGETSQFTDKSYSVGDKIQYWYWDLGNGTASGAQNPSEKYLTDKTYTVKLFVTNTAGCTEYISTPYTIWSRPVVSFTNNPKCDKNTISFVNTSSGKQALASQIWYRGDNTKAITYNDTHLYSKYGFYTTKLVVTTEKGCKDSLSKTTTVYPNPTAKLTIDDSAQCLTQHTFHMADVSTIPWSSLSSKWTLSNGVTSTSKLFNYRFVLDGFYTTKLVSISNYGCKDSVSATIRVKPSVIPNYLVNNIPQCFNVNQFTFTEASTLNKGTYIYRWEYGDGSKDTGKTVKHKYADTGLFYVRLITKTNLNCLDTMIKTVRVLPMPKAKFSVPDTNQCLTTNKYIISNNTTINWGKLTAYWTFGDGTNSSVYSPSKSYAAIGRYLVTLYAKSNFGCGDTTSQYFRVNVMAKPSFTVNDSDQCFSQNVFKFTNTSTIPTGTLTAKWSYGNGVNSTTYNPTYTFPVYGNYTVKLRAISNFGCTDSITKSIIVYPMPVVKIQVNDTDQCINQQKFTFTDISTIPYGTTTRKWMFHDSSSLNAVVNRTYPKDTFYYVKLIKTSQYGCIDSARRKMILFTKPIPSYTFNDSDQCLRWNTFILTSTSTIKNGSFTYIWKYPDNTTQNTSKGTYKHALVGNFYPKIVVTSNNGCVDSFSRKAITFPMPVSKISFNDSDQCVRYNSFTVTASSTVSSGTVTNKGFWGDGNTYTGNSNVNRYTNSGTYNVINIATTNNNCIDTVIKKTIAFPMPVSKYKVNDSAQCFANQSFVLTDLSSISSGTYTRKWIFADSISSRAIVTRKFTPDTTHYITLVATSNFGCLDTFKNKVTVHSMPKVLYLASDTSMCFNQNTFTYTNKSGIRKGKLTFKWTYSDTKSDTAKSPTHVFASFGNYPVKLVATSEKGCKDSISKTTYVRPMPKTKIGINDSTQCVNQQLFTFNDLSTVSYGTFSRKWKFHDSTSTAKSPSRKYGKDTFYKVKLVTTSQYGCMDSTSLSIEVYPKPYPSFTTNDTDQCLRYNNFQFTNQTKVKYGSIAKNVWKFSDGKTQTITNGSNKYPNFNTHFAQLTTTTNFGCVDSIKKTMIVWPMPVSKYYVKDSAQCYRTNSFALTPKSTINYGSLTYKTTWGDTIQAASAVLNHIYPNYGTFQLAFISTSNNQCIDTFFSQIVVHPMPKAKFTINDTAQCINNQNFIFTDVSTIPLGSLSRRWIFSGTNNFASPTTFNFVPDTNHIVALIETSNKGCLDSAFRLITVHSKPTPLFSVNDSAQCLRQNNYLFTNKSGIRKGTLTYNWTFNDLTTSTSISPSHKYKKWGFYRTILKATSEKGCSDTVGHLIKVNDMPLVDLNTNDSTQCVNNQSFAFTSLSTVGEGNLASSWFINDGFKSNLKTFTRFFPKDTIYDIKLVEKTNQGCMDSVTEQFVTYPKPMENFDINAVKQCLYQNKYMFTNKTTVKYGSMAHKWEFGDGAAMNAPNASHFYLKDTTYVVKLTTITNFGCTDTISKIVEVMSMPKVNFSINNAGQCFRTQDFQLQDLTKLKKGSLLINWDLGDSSQATGSNTNHSYIRIGNYRIKMVATTDFGCKDSMSKQVWVNPNSIPSFTINDTGQCEPNPLFVFQSNSNIIKGNIVQYVFNLGRNDIRNGSKHSKNYGYTGIETITMYAYSDSGCIDSLKRKIQIYPKPKAKMGINDSAQCIRQNSYLFTNVSTDSFGLKNTYWKIDNINYVDPNSVSYKFRDTGYQKIMLVQSNVFDCFDTLNKLVYVKPMPDPTFAKLKDHYCQGTPFEAIVPNTPGGVFEGHNMQGNFYVPNVLWGDTVKYRITVNGCSDSSTQYTQVFPQPSVDLGNDTTICKNEILEFQIKSWNSTYQWNDGITTPFRRINKAGTYMVNVTNICGMVSDTIRVGYLDEDCHIIVPNAFTPNQDGKNDFYKPVTTNVNWMKFEIINRWGEILYKGDQYSQGWDGNANGAPAMNGAYILNYQYQYRSAYRDIVVNKSMVFYLLR